MYLNGCPVTNENFAVMPGRLLAACVLLVCTVALQPVHAQQADWSVFTSVTALAADSGEVQATERFAVELDLQPLTTGGVTPGELIAVTLPEGVAHFAVQSVSEHMPGALSIAALASDGSGDKLALTFGDGSAAGVLTYRDEHFHLEWKQGQPVLVRIGPDGHDELGCAIHELEDGETFLTGDIPSFQPSPSPVHVPTMERSVADPVTIDILLGYTTNARQWATTHHGSIETLIGQMMNLSQLAVDNSETLVTLRVVHAYEVDYDETIPNIPGISASGSHLRRLTASPTDNPWGAAAAGFMEEIHDLRDEYGADLVSLLAEVSGFGGVAWLMNHIAGSPHRGFSVNRVQQMATGYTFVHEVGHNMGSHHSRNQNSAAAGERGGIFPYSTGWRWTGDNGLSYASVMTYAQNSTRVAHFSDPNILFQGAPSGSYVGTFAPADNARSMRETKRIVAAYRPTLVDPPVLAVDTPEIDVTLEPDGSTTASVQISNTGESDLLWQLELVGASADARMDSGTLDEAISLSADHSIANPQHGSSLSPTDDLREENVIYETAFGVEDGFQSGQHIHESGWTARQDTSPFFISTANPSTGSQHLRITSPPGNSNAVWVDSPFFGPWPSGGYEFSMDVSVDEPGGPSFFFILYDGRSGLVTAALSYSGNEQLFAFGGLNDSGGSTYTAIGRSWTPGEYETLTMRIRPEDAEIDYVFDGEVAATRPFYAGSTPGLLRIVRNSGSATGRMDVDNLSVRKLYRGLPWLESATTSGVVEPGAGSTVSLTIDATDLLEGTYEAQVIVQSNDPDQPDVTIPVTVTVSGSVGTEPGGEAGTTRLLSSYPNPAGSSARIAYHLAEAGPVTLELFTITGQRVARLADAVQGAGRHEVAIDGQALAAGVYVYRLTAGDVVDSGRLVILP